MFEICARLGSRDDRLQRYGLLLGMLYHGCDDVADVRGTTALGGGSEKDIVDGILTLPAAIATRDPATAAPLPEGCPRGLSSGSPSDSSKPCPRRRPYLDRFGRRGERPRRPATRPTRSCRSSSSDIPARSRRSEHGRATSRRHRRRRRPRREHARLESGAATGARVVLLERARFPREKVCGDYVEPRGLAILAGDGLPRDARASARRCPITALGDLRRRAWPATGARSRSTAATTAPRRTATSSRATTSTT